MQQKAHLSGSIFYSSIQPSSWDIYQIDPSTTLPTTITENGSLNYHPAYHPDGRYLVFTSECDGIAHLYCWDSMQKDRLPFRLTDNPHFEDQVAFSPDGQFIYFVSTRDNDVADIYQLKFTVDTVQDFTSAVNLTQGEGNNLHPDVSPDGEYLVFSSNRNHPIDAVLSPIIAENYRATNIFKMHISSKTVTQLTQDEQWDGSPAWSKDGQTIYFYSTRAIDGKTKPHIYSMMANGENVQMVLNKNVRAMSPKVMPNGDIAFTVIQKSRYSIMSVSPGKKTAKLMTPPRINCYGAFFHPKTSECVAFGDGLEQPNKPLFLNENPTDLKKPLGVGPFLINHYQRPDFANLDLHSVRGFYTNYDPVQRRILCVEGTNKVVLMNVDGSEKVTIFVTDAKIAGIHWSPDKTWFAAAIGNMFTQDPTDIWKISMDGKQQMNLTPQLPGHKLFPRIHPDGNSIYFCSAQNKASMQIHVVDQQGVDLGVVTKDAARHFAPVISPDGKQLLYSAATSKDNYHLYLMSTSSNEAPVQLTSHPRADLHAAFSPDGAFVIFSSERGGLLEELPLLPVFCPQPYGDIYAIRLSDKAIFRITESKWENSLPEWQPTPRY